jgi:hypothetical protein
VVRGAGSNPPAIDRQYLQLSHDNQRIYSDGPFALRIDEDGIEIDVPRSLRPPMIN